MNTIVHYSSEFVLLALTLGPGCGFSQNVNENLKEQEEQFKVEATKQILQQTNLIVGGVVARTAWVEPRATARCESIPSSQCTVCYVASDKEQSLNLSTPSCSIDAPSQGKDFSLQLSLRDLSFAATQTESDLITLRGQGHLDLRAQLPLLGNYTGTAAYQVRSGQIQPKKGDFSIDLSMNYQSGENTLVEISVVVAGTSERMQGSLIGAGLDCKVAGTLRNPMVTCI